MEIFVFGLVGFFVAVAPFYKVARVHAPSSQFWRYRPDECWASDQHDWRFMRNVGNQMVKAMSAVNSCGRTVY
jgi:hypothetical protein